MLKFKSPFSRGLPEGEDAVLVYAKTVRDFYDSRARWHRRFYRWTGVYLIISGSSLPVLAAMTYTGKDLAVSLVGVSVAVLTSLRAFYRWDQSWILLRRTEMAITNEILSFETARNRPGAEIDKRTDRLRQRIHLLRQDESNSFFKGLSFPDPDKRETTQAQQG